MMTHITASVASDRSNGLLQRVHHDSGNLSTKITC